MSILFVKCETSGKFIDSLPLSHAQQPWAVSMAAELCAMDGTPLDFFSTRIRADGRKISEGARNLHGISSADAGKSGVSDMVALGFVCAMAKQAHYVVGHNIDFDKRLIEGLLLRMNKPTDWWIRPGLQFICTMKAATPLCRCEHEVRTETNSFRWPKLSEACEILLGDPPANDHYTAYADMQRAKRLFTHLRGVGVIGLEEAA
jgi:DNA polymerase-3 subunit alpha